MRWRRGRRQRADSSWVVRRATSADLGGSPTAWPAGPGHARTVNLALGIVLTGTCSPFAPQTSPHSPMPPSRPQPPAWPATPPPAYRRAHEPPRLPQRTAMTQPSAGGRCWSRTAAGVALATGLGCDFPASERAASRRISFMSSTTGTPLRVRSRARRLAWPGDGAGGNPRSGGGRIFAAGLAAVARQKLTAVIGHGPQSQPQREPPNERRFWSAAMQLAPHWSAPRFPDS